jgi:hypothetical protein
MADVSVVKNVSSGLAEYIACGTFGRGETLCMEFNQEITIDDMIVNSGFDEPNVKLSIVYPSIAQEATLVQHITVQNYFLNTVQIDRPPNEYFENQAGKRWYHLPARSKIFLEIDGEGEQLPLRLVVIGRSS